MEIEQLGIFCDKEKIYISVLYFSVTLCTNSIVMSLTPSETLMEIEQLDIFCDEEKVFRFQVIMKFYYNCNRSCLEESNSQTCIWVTTCDFQQCGILTSVDSDEPVQHSFKGRNSKCCLVSSLTVIEYSSDSQRLWSDCAYAQADLRLCWSFIPHCWKSHALAHITFWLVHH